MANAVQWPFFRSNATGGTSPRAKNNPKRSTLNNEVQQEQSALRHPAAKLHQHARDRQVAEEFVRLHRVARHAIAGRVAVLCAYTTAHGTVVGVP